MSIQEVKRVIMHNGKEYYPGKVLANFTLLKADSSNVDWVGHDDQNRIFIQFLPNKKTGAINSYIYEKFINHDALTYIKDKDTLKLFTSNTYKLMQGAIFKKHPHALITDFKF